jgi:hypothetical protein
MVIDSHKAAIDLIKCCIVCVAAVIVICIHAASQESKHLDIVGSYQGIHMYTHQHTGVRIRGAVSMQPVRRVIKHLDIIGIAIK